MPHPITAMAPPSPSRAPLWQGRGALRIQGRLSKALHLQEESKATLGQEHGFEESCLRSHGPKIPGLGVHETREGATEQRDAKGPEGTP